MPIDRNREMPRSGRFISQSAAATTTTIIRSGNQPIRVHNSGKTPFKLQPKGDSTDEVTVRRRCSVDVDLNGSDVLIAQAANTLVEGIYEYIDPVFSRSGRIKGPAGTPIVIAQGKPQPFYRILNAGENDLTVTVNGVNYGTVRPKHSLDVVAKNQKVVVTGSGTSDVQGIYDCLNRRSNARSGRFKIKKVEGDNPIDPSDEYKIINLTDANSPVWYRIFNSGENVIEVVEAGTKICDLNPDQSFDFKVDASIIEVRSTDEELPIEGMYEFIRRE